MSSCCGHCQLNHNSDSVSGNAATVPRLCGLKGKGTIVTKRLEKLYRECRQHKPFMLVGSDAALSLSTARTLLAWKALEDAGFVRLETEPEDNPDVSYFDTWDHLSEQSKERMIERIDRLGIWVVMGQYRIDVGSDDWETADSIEDCQGYEDATDWRQNCYVPDIMAATIEALKGALAARYCENCGHMVH